MIVFLEYQENSIRLEDGITTVGRGISCNIRFNDPAVSRQHLRFIVEKEMASVEDLGTTNGSKINDMPLKGKRVLADGDELRIGHRVFEVRMMGEAELTGASEDTTVDRSSDQWLRGKPRERPTPPGGTPRLDPSGTRPTPFAGTPKVVPTERPTPPRGTPKLDEPMLGTVPLPKLTQQNCRKCRAKLPMDADSCPKCGYKLPRGRPLSVTQRISIKDLEKERRKGPRLPVDIPILYSSDTLTFDAVARDLSQGGIFVASELLDPIGTPCNITLLPDGAPPLSASGVVCHVIVTETGEEGHPPGLGIKFTKLGEDARKWIGNILQRAIPA